MSQFTGLINSGFKQLHVDMIAEVIRAGSVPCDLVYGSTLFEDCPNCVFDPIRKVSSNIYQSGGPVPFTFGICPQCNGIGQIPDDTSVEICLAPIYDYKYWIPGLMPNLHSPYGWVQTWSLFDTYEELTKAKEIIINTDTNSYVKARFERQSAPQPYGFNGSDFIAVAWKRIEN